MLHGDTKKIVEKNNERSLRNKSMKIGDQVVYLQNQKPSFGVIDTIFSRDGYCQAQVSFVSIFRILCLGIAVLSSKIHGKQNFALIKLGLENS